jgi:DeoR family transcriptional regulator, aga operon transcriptional repressor
VRKSARWDAVLARLAKDGDLDVVTLAAELGCSPSTIRRDLRELESHHLLSRVYGGAVSTGILYELPLDHRAGQRQDEKRWIAAEAVRRIEPGMVVGITGGTTTAATVREFINQRRTDVTVVTNSLAIAQDLSLSQGCKVVVTGGFVRPASLELVGPLPELIIPKVNLDLVFLGVDGISAEAGLTIHNDLEARTNELLMRRARSRLVLADHSKIGRVAFAQICALPEITELITDLQAPDAQVALISAGGVAVTLAGPAEGTAIPTARSAEPITKTASS